MTKQRKPAGGTNYYAELIANIGKSMKAHPRSTVLMDADSFKVIGAARNPTRLSAKFKRALAGRRQTVVFQGPDKKAIWILPTASRA